jgi:ribokinase
VDVVVLGSANLDLVFSVRAHPRPGETVLASAYGRHCGGKGLNQAIAAARAGARTAFVGAVGQDEAGSMLADVLDRNGVETPGLRRVNVHSGTAVITVDEKGENAIVVAPGANGTVAGLEPNDVEAISSARVLVTQLEIPLGAVAEAAALAHRARTAVILNAAPARPLDESLLGQVDVLVVNEHEVQALTGVDDYLAAARRLVDHCGAVVVTLGPHGAVGVRSEGAIDRAPAERASVVDTTGAGDAFTGYLAAGLAEGMSLEAAMRRAVTAGTLTVARKGAEPSIPTRSDVEEAVNGPGLDG